MDKELLDALYDELNRLDPDRQTHLRTHYAGQDGA